MNMTDQTKAIDCPWQLTPSMEQNMFLCLWRLKYNEDPPACAPMCRGYKHAEHEKDLRQKLAEENERLRTEIQELRHENAIKSGGRVSKSELPR